MENTHIKTEETTSVTTNNETATVASNTDNGTVTSASNSSGFQPFEQLHEAVLAAVNSHGMPPGERKKKWRIHNEERNKDNDLRCRVNKRANKLYGPSESEIKTKWIKEEFEKRRQKRMDKERRKHIVNNVLSVPGTTETTINNVVDNNNNTINDQMNYYTPLPQIDTDTADKLLNFPTDLQRQLLEQLNNSMLALANGMQTTTNSSQTEEEVQAITQGLSSNTSTTSSEHNSPLVAVNDDEKGEEEPKEKKKPEYPMDAVLTLMQLNAGWRQ
ncbi:hypothetical protein INT48_004333 [Thamnidium elegans]|uniref:DUF3020 domain-containing protein n=1 Tax=Thamnidium elegans TaxID=101142 RepID=A0A8H7W114_9FUNG|nr:hypothetical protein INT48_004333 [Thamnidium elegans]